MDCRKVRELIPLVSGGDSETADVEFVKNHIASCSTCNKLYQKYIADRHALNSLNSFTLSDSIEERLKAISNSVIANRTTSERKKKVTPFAVRIVRVLTGTALILIALLALVFYLGGQKPPKQEKAPEGIVERIEYNRMIKRAIENATLDEKEKVTPAEREKCRVLDSADTSSFDF
jgi:hypothetical protein